MSQQRLNNAVIYKLVIARVTTMHTGVVFTVLANVACCCLVCKWLHLGLLCNDDNDIGRRK